jgi:hypothetical protein
VKWEYKCATFVFNKNADLQEKLNELGLQGYELVSIETIWLDDIAFYSADCIFKREKPRPAGLITTDGLAYAVLAPRHTEEEEA